MGQPDRVLREAAEGSETCRLVFRTPAGTGTVWLENGQLVDAVIQGIGGERALLRILSNRSVRYSRESGPKARSRRLDRSLAEYVAQANARRVEWADLVHRLPPLASVLSRTGAPPPDASQDVAAVLSLIDGTRPLFGVIDEAHEDAQVVLRAVDQLLRAGTVTAQTSVETAPEGSLGITLDLPRDAETLAALATPQEETPESPVFPLTQQHHAPAEEPAHPVVGRYEVLGRLGRGGMATVYLCRTRGEAGFTRRFAMKVLRTHLSDSAEANEMLLREARFTGRLHHPNVVSVVDVGSNRGQPYLVMDYVPGCSAATLLQAAERGALQLTERVAAAITLEALAGLHAAHTLGDSHGQALGLVHQDVSPENLLVGFDGVTRVSDFGVAQVTGALAPDESEHGKPQYLAPERVLGKSFDHRADLFAAGVVLYRLLTGVEPFGAETAEESLEAVLSRPVPPPSTVGKRPLAIFDAICLRALERSPDDRYQSAEHFRGELLRVAVLNDQLALSGEVADAARRAVDALSPGSRLAQAAGDKPQPAAMAPGAAIVLVRRKPRAQAGGETVELAPARAAESKPLPLWAVAVFLIVSIGLALALQSLGGDEQAPLPRIPIEAHGPKSAPSSDDPLGPNFLERVSDPPPAPSAPAP